MRDKSHDPISKMSHGRKRRSLLNAVSFLVTCSVLLLTIALADGNFTKRINEISRSLDKAIVEMLELEKTNYTEFDSNVSYHSSTHFNPKGMGGLYNITGLFMNLLMPQDKLYPEGFIEVDDGQIYVNYDDWKSLATFYVGLLVLVAIMIVFAVFMPVCGLCFCCCRCCGNCGARSKPFDKKGDLCKKIILATLLIVLGTLLLFGVVCSFVSNQYMQDGTEELTGNLNTSMADAQTYLKTTGKHVDTIFNVNYDQFEQTTFDILSKTSQIVFDELQEYSHAVSMTKITQIVEELPGIQNDLETLKISTNELRVNASQLNDALRKVKREMLATLVECMDMDACSRLSGNISTLGSDIDFDNLPDITDSTNELESILREDIQNSVEEGQKKLEEIKEKIESAVNENLVQVKAAISEAGFAIKNASRQVNEVLGNLSKMIDTGRDSYLADADRYINKYSPYRYYLGVGVSCILLFITLCVALGLICGICGKRPDAYGDDCCNKGSGSRFLMCGIMVMFLSAFFLAVVTIFCFVLGMLSQKVVCDSFRNPTESQLLNLANDVLNLNRTVGVNATVQEILTSCEKNQSIYNVFKLKSVFDLEKVDDYIEQYSIEEELNKLAENIDVNFDNIEILSEEAKVKLDKLAESGIDNIEFDKFTGVLDNNFTTISLNTLVVEINKLLEKLEGKPDITKVIEDLRLNVLHLSTYQTRLVEPMTNAATNMVKIAKELQEKLKFNETSFANAINKLVEEVKRAEETLKAEGRSQLIAIAKKFSTYLTDHTRTYLDRVVDNTNNSIGQCGPLSVTFNAVLISTCDKVLLPLNGFWFGLFWSLILFIPTIIVSVKLATLYQKYNPYSDHLTETEILYDMYADREHIPLNSRNGKKKKKHKKGRREDRSLPGPAGDPDGRRDYPGGSHPQDTRYADMAPKHWEEFPANGPPHYQRAPTEYERPPPYYYPGSGDEH